MAVTDYYLLDYIESKASANTSQNSAGCVINTGVTGSAYYVIHDMQFISNGRQLFGPSGNSSDYWGVNDSGQIELGGKSTGWAAYNRMTITYSPGSNTQLILNGSRYNTENTVVSGYPYLIGAIGTNSSGTVWYYNCKYKMYSTKIYNNSNILLRNMIPARRISDSVCGLYDLVNNQFYPSNGSTAFSAGSLQAAIVQLSINNTLWGTISSTTGYKYVDGSVTVTLTATPKTGCTFSGWYDADNNLVSNSKVYSYTGPVNSGLTAVFAVPHIYLKIGGHWKDIV